MYFTFLKISNKPFVQFDFVGNNESEVLANGLTLAASNLLSLDEIDDIGYTNGVFNKKVDDFGNLVDWTAEEKNSIRNDASLQLQLSLRALLKDLLLEIQLCEELGENKDALEAQFIEKKQLYLNEKNRLVTENSNESIITEGGEEIVS